MNAHAPITPDHGLTTAALLGEAILRAIAERLAANPEPFKAAAEVAQAAGRPAKNIRRELAQLQAAGLITADWRLEPAAASALAALDRAAQEGGQGLLRVPYGRLKPNPMNPAKRRDDAGIDGLADTIHADGDILQPLLVSPPDASGERTIWAGERRWRAVRRLAAGGDLPDALKAGLPCVERAADAAQALFIAVVENSQREGLTPWEDAQALKALADETGWSAREVALRVGRAHQGSEAGVRDVQVKIKLAREASPEAIAEYERMGNYDALRASVQTGEATRVKAPGADGEAPATPDMFDASPAFEVRGDGVHVKDGRARAWPMEPEPTRPVVADIVLSMAEQLILVELAHACDHVEGRLEPSGAEPHVGVVAYAPAGKYWLDQTASGLQNLRLIYFKHHGRPYAGVTPLGWEWLAARDYPRPVDYARVFNCQGVLDRVPTDLDRPYATSWLNPDPEEAAPAAGASAPADADPEPEDVEDAAAAAVLDLARIMLAGMEGPPAEPDGKRARAFRELLEATGAPASWRLGAAGVAMAGENACACVIDVDNALPDAIATARTLAVILAVNHLAGVETPAGEVQP